MMKRINSTSRVRMISKILSFFLCLTLILPISAEEDPISIVNEWFNQEYTLNPTGRQHKFACLCTVSKDLSGKGRIIEIVKWDQDGALFFTHT